MTQNVADKEQRERWLAFMRTLTPEISPQATRLMDEMRTVSRTLYHVGENSLTASGLSFAQYRILMHLLFSERMEGRSDLNPSEISDRHGVSRNTISSLIRNLEAEGLIARHLDEQDRRRFNICLTENGRFRVLAHVQQHMRVMGNCFSALSGDEQQTLSQLLSKLGKNLAEIIDKG
jgi:DNA-binding MarR family transcriptional regulator